MGDERMTSVNTLNEDSYLVQESEAERIKREQLAGSAYRLSDTDLMPAVEHEGANPIRPWSKTD